MSREINAGITTPRAGRRCGGRHRRHILETAHRLFVPEHGYPATRAMAAIAAAAEVSLKTVYLAFETKSGLLGSTCGSSSSSARTTSTPYAQRAWYREVVDEIDPKRQLQLNARNYTGHGEQAAGLDESDP